MRWGTIPYCDGPIENDTMPPHHARTFVMRLHVENFAKISSADIEFDGLTVIAGKNNTGKSTVGKILYTFFRALSQLPKRVKRDRVEAVIRAFSRNVDREITAEQAQRLLAGEVTAKEIYEEIKANEPKDDSAYSLFLGHLPQTLSDFSNQDIAKTLDQVRSTSDDDIAGRLAYQVVDCVFHRQVRPLRKVSGETKLVLYVQGEDNEILFSNDGGRIRHATQLVKKVRLIANPDVLSLLNVRDIATNKTYARAFEKYTLELAQELVKESRLSAAEEEAVRVNLAEIIELLDGVIHGNFTLDEENDFALIEDGNEKPTKAENLSMGMKFFVLLRFMLLHGVLQNRDVLILDEPENHLHPTLQIVYAKVLVLLQKKFNLTILLTSHSTFFVNAVKRFCVVELEPWSAHFYLSKEDPDNPGLMTFEDRSDMTGPIFREFNEAYELVDDLSKGGEVEGESQE